MRHTRENFERSKINNNAQYQKAQTGASMNNDTFSDTRKSKQISLNASEKNRIQRPKAGENIEIYVENGTIRIGAVEQKTGVDLTLAFACKSDDCKFCYPQNLDINIEALTDSICLIRNTNERKPNESDAIVDWVIQLHVVRQERSLDDRLMKLFYLLTTRLGKRTAQGLELDHTLSHARIAEIVGSTRSTVSRTISKLRKTEQLYIDDLRNQLVLPVK